MIFCKKNTIFFGVSGGELFYYFQTLLFQGLSLRFNYKNISFKKISDDFFAIFQETSKEHKILNIGRLAVCQFSLDCGFGLLLPISTKYHMSEKSGMSGDQHWQCISNQSR